MTTTNFVVHKQILNFDPTECVVKMPKDSKILDVQMQDENMVIWYMHDNNTILTNRYFILIGTGWEVSDINIKSYIKTIKDGLFIWHIFEVQ